ncbi:MAG: sugar phosphate isomerase/epimerase [Phycisphaeraceae bacterium]
MSKSVIGAQLYTVRDYVKNAEDFAKTCARLRQMGYEAVQVSAVGPIEAKEMRRILDGEGLACVVTHKSMDDMKKTEQVLEFHQTLGCKYTAIGGFGWDGPDLAKWKAFIKEFSEVARTLAAKGLFVGYHNHSHELSRISDSPKTLPLQLLLDECDRSVWFEIDTYWIQHGGGDPAAWIDNVAGRIPCVHVKDMAIAAKREQKMCEVGSGNLNWPRILESCKKAGVEWYLVERDSGDLDPFESLKISLDNLRAMGLQ